MGGFVLVPLPLLATGWDMREIVDLAFAYSTERLAINLREIDEIAEDQEPAELYSRARRKIDVRFGNISPDRLPSFIQDRHETVVEVLENYAETNAQKWANVYGTIPTIIALALAKGEWPENRGRVLIAMASLIGKKPYTCAGWKSITHRAAGYVWEPKKFRLPGGKQDSPTPRLLSRTQVDYQLSALRQLNLVESFTYKRGKRYWSFPARCTREEMARKVITARKNATRESDSALTARIEAELNTRT